MSKRAAWTNEIDTVCEAIRDKHLFASQANDCKIGAIVSFERHHLMYCVGKLLIRNRF